MPRAFSANVLARFPWWARADEPCDVARVTVGQHHEIPLGEEDSRLEVTTPSGHTLKFEHLKGRHQLDFAATDEPGVYHVEVGRADDAMRSRPAADFVVNLEPNESDLTPLSPERLAALARGGSEVKSVRPALRRLELWHALGAAFLLLLLGETLLSRRK